SAADGMNEIRVRAGGDGDARSGRGDVRVAAEVAIVNRIKPGGGAVVAAEPIAPVIARAGLLREAAGGPPPPRGWGGPEIPATNVHFCTRGSRSEDAFAGSGGQSAEIGDDAAEESVSAVDPIIQAEAEAVDARLVIAGVETGEDFFDDVRLAITVSVLG